MSKTNQPQLSIVQQRDAEPSIRDRLGDIQVRLYQLASQFQVISNAPEGPCPLDSDAIQGAAMLGYREAQRLAEEIADVSNQAQ